MAEGNRKGVEERDHAPEAEAERPEQGGQVAQPARLVGPIDPIGIVPPGVMAAAAPKALDGDLLQLGITDRLRQ